MKCNNFLKKLNSHIKKQLYPKKSYNNGKVWKGILKHIYILALASKYLRLFVVNMKNFKQIQLYKIQVQAQIYPNGLNTKKFILLNQVI